jgi:hypothetical protein
MIELGDFTGISFRRHLMHTGITLALAARTEWKGWVGRELTVSEE